MLQNILPANVKIALRLSFGFWALGVMFSIPFIFFGFNVLSGIRLALFINPLIIFILSRFYLKTAKPKNYVKDGFIFGVFLALTHMPADALFIFLFFKEGLILFNSYLGLLFYGEMMALSALAGLLRFKSK